MLIATFKRDHDLFSPANNPFLFNEPHTLDHLRLLLFETYFLQYLVNTFFVGLVLVLITLVTAIPAAYSLARWARGWGELLGIGIFLTYLVPPTILFIPLSRFTSASILQESLGCPDFHLRLGQENGLHRRAHGTGAGRRLPVGPLLAGALLAGIPVAVVYTFFLDRFIAGFTMGAVK